MNIIEKITSFGTKRMHIYEDPVTKVIPYFAVIIFVGMALYVAYDYFMVIR